ACECRAGRVPFPVAGCWLLVAGYFKAKSSNSDRIHDVVRRDLLHDVDATRDLAEHGVDAVQVTRVLRAQDHEELTAAGVLSRVRHGERADLVLVRIVGRLALDLPTRTAGSDARIAGREIARQRISALPHEIGNDAMELHTIVKAAVRKLLEVFDRDRRFLLIQVGDDGPFVGLERGGFWHGGNLASIRYQVPGTRYQVPGSWHLAHGTWHL